MEGEGGDNAVMSARAKGVPKPPLPRAASNFVGLQNQGATCYLNALLQCLFLTPELRCGLFGIDPDDLGAQHVYGEETKPSDPGKSSSSSAGKENSPQQEQEEAEKEPDEDVVEQLQGMGFSFPCAHRCALAVATSTSSSSSSSDAFSAALEYALEHSEDPGMNDPLPLPSQDKVVDNASGEQKKKRGKPRMIPLELQRLFSQLQAESGLDRLAVSTHELTEKGFQWTGMDGSVQHDAHELNR